MTRGQRSRRPFAVLAVTATETGEKWRGWMDSCSQPVLSTVTLAPASAKTMRRASQAVY
jgi:hypothetical protein